MGDDDEDDDVSLLDADAPPSCHHYERYEDVPADLQKYWLQRYNIFSRYDDGIWLTDAAWYGVTPEPVASTIADHIAEVLKTETHVIIDVFAGVGGNTIAFARSGQWQHVVAIEKDPDTFACLKHNASVYGVADRITFLCGDAFDILQEFHPSSKEQTVIFASPPWGGPGYASDVVFDVDKMEPYSLSDLYQAFRMRAAHQVLYLPRTTDLTQLAKYALPGYRIAVTHYCMAGASKALCVYLTFRS